MKPQVEAELMNHWTLLWYRLLSGRSSESAKFINSEWERRAKRYNNPDRGYHDLEHILYLVRILIDYRHLATNLDALLLSAFDHDWFYFTEWRPEGAQSNETLSAEASDETLMRASKLPGSRVTREFRNAVRGYIMVTHHKETVWRPRNRDEMLMADVDWSPMGWAWADFVENGKKIRH